MTTTILPFDKLPETLVARSVSLRRGGRAVVSGVDLALRGGEVVGILGPNGAGKSSLLKLLSGSVTPDEGTVSLEGRPLSRWGRESLARRRAVLPQQLEVAFGFTAWEVALLGRIPHHRGIPSPRDREITQAAMAEVDAEALAGQRYPTLSGGERARVQLARVLAQVWSESPRGEVLLLDEPSAPMDVSHQLRLSGQLRALAARGYAVAVIVHDLNLAAATCDRVLFMRQGKALHFGPPAQVFSPKVLQEVFDVRAEVTHPDARPHVRLLAS
ncbi:MAG: heme ABC transporter ATP-binding protein [Halothiobacillaceae bacterium]